MTTSPSHAVIGNVEQWNDRFASEHDIDAYYERSSRLIRWVECRRLAWIRWTVAAKPGDRILEVGCGGGHVLKMFPQADRTGTDVSGIMLEKARRNLYGENVRLLKGELDRLDLPRGYFDVVICTEVIEHVIDPDQLLSHIRTLLHPAGRLVITFPNDALIHTIKSVIRGSGLGRFPGLSRISWGGDEFHLHRWSIREMRELLCLHGCIEQETMIPSRLMPIRCAFRCGTARS